MYSDEREGRVREGKEKGDTAEYRGGKLQIFICRLCFLIHIFSNVLYHKHYILISSYIIEH